jgi:hypothetical protein
LKKIHKSSHIFVEERPCKVVFLPIIKRTTYSIFFLSKSQTKANIERIKLDKTTISLREKKDCIKALTIVFKPTTINQLINNLQILNNIPGTTATVFNALNTRNVRSTATFPKLTKNVTYLKKSNEKLKIIKSF